MCSNQVKKCGQGFGSRYPLRAAWSKMRLIQSGPTCPSGVRVERFELWILGGFGVWGLECGVWGLGCGVWGGGCGVWGAGCGLKGVKCRVWGVECRVWRV